MGTWMEERKISMSEDKKLEDTELEKKETEEKCLEKVHLCLKGL